jgi:hypothetical protein
MLQKSYPSKQPVKMPAIIRTEGLGLLTALRSGIVGNFILCMMIALLGVASTLLTALRSGIVGNNELPSEGCRPTLLVLFSPLLEAE